VSPLTAIDRFEGDFDLLPFTAHVRYGAVPLYPTNEDFHNFVSTKVHEERPEACWQLEAIRWRLHNPGKPLDGGLKAIALATAESILRMGGRGA
jgi:hypothetical protein